MSSQANTNEASTSNPDTARTASPGRLRSILLRAQEPILLIGAGASITSGIPAAGKTVEKAARWAWCQDQGRHTEDYTIRRSDYWPWVTAQPWFQNDVVLADLYPVAIDNLLGVKSDRRQFFEDLINPKVAPSRGYRALANILQQGWITTVLTTNFDECLQRVVVLENKPHRLITITTPDDHILFSSAPHDPQLIYLHGSVKHYTDKNLSDEVQSLDPAIVDRLTPLFRDHPVIVVGYRGSEKSVMNDLFLQRIAPTNSFVHGVYWCVMEDNLDAPMADYVQELAAAIGSNFQRVPISGFDDLFEQELFEQMKAAGAKPTRRPTGFSVGEVPTDMKVLDGVSVDALQRTLLHARLSQYAKRTDLWTPEDRDETWVDQMAERLDLIRSDGDKRAPTLAGWLLFSSIPTQQRPEARVEFRARGAAEWLKSCFGEDTDLTPTNENDVFIVERTITGNLWTQLDTLTDLLSLANFQFRLKAEVSKTVNAYDALAVKEMIVNAIVHRDYEVNDPIVIDVETNSITVISPGGLVDLVAAQARGKSFQDAIAERTRPIKGYRNPAISDLFYGGGEMDRRGSGLSDMVLLTKNNNGAVSFGPDDNNTSFTVQMEARPEAVDELTQTALPIEAETVRFAANLIPIDAMPTTIWHAGTNARSNRSFFRNAEDLAAPPGHVADGRFYSLYDLAELADALVTPFDPGDIETLSLDEVLDLPNGEAIVLKLLYDSLFSHLRARGLRIDYQRRRAHFPRGEEPEVKITYRGRLRKATRTVVKARTKRDSDDVLYYEHKAVTFSVMRFADDWAVVITPGYAFTRDGVGKPIGRDRTNILSTRRAARDFNPSVMHDVTFWHAIISGEADGLFALECVAGDDLAPFGPTILLSHRAPTISYNISAFEDAALQDLVIDEDLEALEKELEALASEPDDEDDVDAIDDDVTDEDESKYDD